MTSCGQTKKNFTMPSKVTFLALLLVPLSSQTIAALATKDSCKKVFRHLEHSCSASDDCSKISCGGLPLNDEKLSMTIKINKCKEPPTVDIFLKSGNELSWAKTFRSDKEIPVTYMNRDASIFDFTDATKLIVDGELPISTHDYRAICYLTRNNTRITCSVKIGENDTTLSFTVRKCGVLTLWVYVDVRTSALSWSSSTSHGSPTHFIVPPYGQGPLFRSRNETFKIELLVSLYRTEADPRLKVELNYWDPDTRLKNDKGPTGEIINRYLPIYCTKVKISFKDPCKVSENDRGTTEVGCRIAMGQNDTSLIMQVSHCDSDKLTYNINLFTKTSYATVEYSKIKTFDRNYMFLPKQEHPLFRIGNTTFMISFYVKLNKSDFGVRLQVRLIYLPRHGGSHVIENFIDVPIKCGWWDSLHTGLKVLVIGAPLLFLLLLIIILVWWCHRKKCSPVSRRWSPQNSN